MKKQMSGQQDILNTILAEVRQVRQCLDAVRTCACPEALARTDSVANPKGEAFPPCGGRVAEEESPGRRSRRNHPFQFRRWGDGWFVLFKDEASVVTKHDTGMRYYHLLIQKPYVKFRALEMLSNAGKLPPSSAESDMIRRILDNVSSDEESDLALVEPDSRLSGDAENVEIYRLRLNELIRKIAVAKQAHDHAELEECRREREELRNSILDQFGSKLIADERKNSHAVRVRLALARDHLYQMGLSRLVRHLSDITSPNKPPWCYAPKEEIEWGTSPMTPTEAVRMLAGNM